VTKRVHVTIEEPASKVPWEAPAATALTDTESRADRSDIWMQNGTVGS
jgi:hypothetical protein